jgi:membrane protein
MSLPSLKRALFNRRAEEPRALAGVRTTGQIVWLLGHDAFEGNLDRHARGLVYSTLIAIIPLLVFAVIVLKTLGVRGVLTPTLSRLLEPLGPGGIQLAHKLLTVVNQVHIGVLGVFGIILLAFAAIMLLLKIESGMDAAWQVTEARVTFSRTLQYLGLLIAGPVLLFAAFGVTAVLTNKSVTEHLSIVGEAVPVFGKILPYVIAVIAFTLLNLITPNARVRFKSALIAGLAGGLVWQAVGQLYAFLTARSTQLSAVYSSFAILIMFLTWLYVSWLILLLGARLGFYIQNPLWRCPAEDLKPFAPASAEASAVDIMLIAAEQFNRGGEPHELGDLVGRLAIPGVRLEPILDHLAAAGLLRKTKKRAYALAGDPRHIGIDRIIDAVRGEAEAGLGKGVGELLRRVRQARTEAFAGTSLADLVGDTPPSGDTPEEESSDR